MEPLLSKQESEETEEKIKSLVGLEKRYYNFLPDVCWMSEENQAKGLGIGRNKLRKIKHKLLDEKILLLETLPNGKRNNLKHILFKPYPISNTTQELVGIDCSRYSLEDEEYTHIGEIDWSLLRKYTAEELNGMDKLALIQLYIEAGFIVLPTHYPIFMENGKKCSCGKGIECHSIGKHPLFGYKSIDASNYVKYKGFYLRIFKGDLNLNIGFKVIGFSVLDIDNKNNGDKSLVNLLAESDIEMNDVTSVNCSNGRHIYTSNTNLKNTAGVLGEGLDIRSDGGFVIAPGSVHKSGKFYKFNKIGKVVRMPEYWFVTDSDEHSSEKKTMNKGNHVTGHSSKNIELPEHLTPDYVIPEGERQDTLFLWASRFRGKGANAETIFNKLMHIRDNHCQKGEEPFTDAEVRKLADLVAASYPTNAEKKLNSFISLND
jgi:hypothetical protein